MVSPQVSYVDKPRTLPQGNLEGLIHDSHSPQLMTLGEGQNVTWLLKWELCVLPVDTQYPSHKTTTVSLAKCRDGNKSNWQHCNSSSCYVNTDFEYCVVTSRLTQLKTQKCGRPYSLLRTSSLKKKNKLQRHNFGWNLGVGIFSLTPGDCISGIKIIRLYNIIFLSNERLYGRIPTNVGLKGSNF